MTPLIRAENLRLVLSRKEIFQVDRFAVNRGDILAVVGPNGAGKTSLLLTLALLETAAEGSIYFNGEEAGNGNRLELRRRMAVVFQESLLLDMSVLDNLITPLRIRGVSRREAASKAEIWLRRLGIDHLARRPARSLSGGEAQRTSLARAFALEPELLFLDEPFASLDYPTRNSLLSELGGILRAMAVTTLFVTHDHTEIPQLADHVAVMYEGRIVKHGTVREVFGDEVLQRRLWVPWEDSSPQSNNR